MKYIANPVEVEAFVIESVQCLKDEPFSQPQSYKLMLREPGPVSPDTLLTCFVAPPEMTARMEPKVGDYLVRQSDGYEYLNPREVFLRKYTALAELAGLSDFERIAIFYLRHIDQTAALNTTLLESMALKTNSPGPQ